MWYCEDGTEKMYPTVSPITSVLLEYDTVAQLMNQYCYIITN
jgi:hypothetical protein